MGGKNNNKKRIIERNSAHNLSVIFKLTFKMFSNFFLDGEPLKLPESLESLPKSDHFPSQRHRWNTNEVRTEIQTKSKNASHCLICCCTT